MKCSKIIWGLLVGSISFFSCSDDDDPVSGADVPVQVQQEFVSRFPDVKDVQWDKVKDYHVARFNAVMTKAAAGAYNTSAWFSKEGKYYQTDEDVDFKDLPALVRDAFDKFRTKRNYQDWEIDDCEVLAREGMATIYVIEIEKGEQEIEISISEAGDILKEVLDDDDDDEILPIEIPEEVHAALKDIFPDTYSSLSILELELDDDEIEIDVMESGRHKEVELDLQYRLVSIEYKVSVKETQELMSEKVFVQLVEMAEKAGIDIFSEEIQKNMEIEVRKTAKGYAFEIEIELEGGDFEVEIDEEGNLKF